MKPDVRRFLLVLIVALIAPLVTAQGWPVQPGSSYGPVKLGQAIAEAERSLGQAQSRKPSASDPSSHMRVYKNSMLLINKEQKILGITLWDAASKTPQGLGVGSSQKQVVAKLGAGVSRGPGSFVYPGSGIGFAYTEQNTVDKVFLFRPEAASALQGDRQAVPGQRCGEIRINMPLSEVVSAWGNCPVVAGQDYRWPDKGVGLLVHEGRVAAITLTTGDYITRQGLKVGSRRSEVVAALGKGEAKGSNLFYPARGIAFYFAGDMVSTLQIFAPMK